MLPWISITKRLGKKAAQQAPQNIVACVAGPITKRIGKKAAQQAPQNIVACVAGP